ncbi:MAG TPA: methionine adenosyltransferase [Chitinophagales bacterium]|nr:methionine adenosyltransferase [Chitinophagales bacterium]
MSYYFTSESVSEGHPDKVADQISDAILDAMLAQDPNSRVACETLVTTGLVTLAGEITTNAYVDVQEVAREAIRKIGYTKDEFMFSANSCSVISALHNQSPDIAQGVNEGSNKEQGAGDQGMMFGYASNESDNYMPLTLEISHLLVQELARIRKEYKVMKYLRPDTKSQVTIEYDDNHRPVRIDTIVVSTQHDDFIKADASNDKATVEIKMQAKIKEDILKYLLPAVKKRLPKRVQKLFNDQIKYHINPTGVFIIGGPHGDSGLTGRKIIVDTYGGRGAHGGGAFSGKDPSKVDRSAAYAARHMAKNLVAARLADQVLVQLSYAIGVAEPISINVNTFNTAKVKLTDSQISNKIIEVFKEDFKPKAIIERLKLKNPIYSATAAYGHMGRPSYEQDVEFAYVTIEHTDSHKIETRKYETKAVEFFTWEKLDYIDQIKSTFNI